MSVRFQVYKKQFKKYDYVFANINNLDSIFTSFAHAQCTYYVVWFKILKDICLESSKNFKINSVFENTFAQAGTTDPDEF